MVRPVRSSGVDEAFSGSNWFVLDALVEEGTGSSTAA
jgi:hypothetical protein